MSLPAFNPDACCQKCNADGASTRYCSIAALREPGLPAACILSKATAPTPGAFRDPTMMLGEHHHRICRVCAFEWLEDVYREPPPSRARRRTTPRPSSEEDPNA